MTPFSEKRRKIARAGGSTIELEEVLPLSCSDLDDEAFGSSLDVKLQGRFGMRGTATSLTNVIDGTPGHTRSISVGPSVQAQANYDNVLRFAIAQNSTIKFLPEIDEQSALNSRPRIDPATREVACYSAKVPKRMQELVHGKYPNLFNRILVDTRLPLAA